MLHNLENAEFAKEIWSESGWREPEGRELNAFSSNTASGRCLRRNSGNVLISGLSLALLIAVYQDRSSQRTCALRHAVATDVGLTLIWSEAYSVPEGEDLEVMLAA